MEEKFMKEALKEAKKAYDKLEVPVGCVIVKDGKIISRAHNLKETKFDTTKHAEILAIQKASKKLKSWRLINCQMYVTLEPCQMCSGAIVQARIPRVVIGTMNAKAGCAGSVINILQMEGFNHRVDITKGVLMEECRDMMQAFFKQLRLEKAKEKQIDSEEKEKEKQI